MESISTFLSWRNVAVAAVVYLASLSYYRLYLHPLARFPGPKIAALTRWYEAYYDVVQNGQYISRVEEMHKKYGPIIRISPYELHVHDPAFFEQLYRQDGRWDKYAWAYDAFAGPGATVFTAEHDLHKARRQPLNSYFAKAKVAKRQDLIKRNVIKLCGRLSEFATTAASDKTTKTVNLGAATSAFARDTASEFIVGKNYNNLDEDDFNARITVVFQGSGQLWRITKHVRWFSPTLMAIPKDWVIKTADKATSNLFRFLQRSEQDVKEIMASASSSTAKDSGPELPRSIVHDILDSGLPPAEKTFYRVSTEVETIMFAGYETTASVLRLVFFHVFSDGEILARLRAEFAAASIPSEPGAVEASALEKLPYLASVIMEGLRLSPGIAARMQRIAPDRDLFYDRWRIPAGTPVGMTSVLLHTDESLYPEPRRFNPDRWVDGGSQRNISKSYAPFSRGTRVCLGMHFAWAEMYLALSALVQQFDFGFEGATAEDFHWASDQFVIGTRAHGALHARVSHRRF
ncbi:cytochrome P450 [Seiridium cupressi]